MHGVFAQDSLSLKMNWIDEIRDIILKERNEIFKIGFPLKWYHESDSVFYYFKNNHLILIEHKSDRDVDGDTNMERFMAYSRVYFYQGKLCLIEEITKSYERVIRWDDKGNHYREKQNSIDETRNYYDLQSDGRLSLVFRRIEAPLDRADSLLQKTEWNYIDISKYKYSRGKNAFLRFLKQIEDNGFILPEGAIMPYSKF